MPSSNPVSGPDADARLDALLASRPLAPAQDFVARTLVRVHAENTVVMALRQGDESALDRMLAAPTVVPAADFVTRTIERIRTEESLAAAARTGDDSAVDALLDHWLADQPLDPNAEPAQLAIQTRHAAAREEREIATPAQAPWRRLLDFPVWARSMGSLAAAAAVAFMVFFGTGAPTAIPVALGPASGDNVLDETLGGDSDNYAGEVELDDLDVINQEMDPAAGAVLDPYFVESLNAGMS
jgi:hypothetical protein